MKTADRFIVAALLIQIPCHGVGNPSGGGNTSPKIQSIQVTQNVVSYPYFGDLWTNTWADDDKLYLSFGDGTGAAAAPTVDGIHPGAFSPRWAGATQMSPGCFHIPPAPANTRDPIWRLFCQTFGTAANACHPLSRFTDSGLVVLSGPVPDFKGCTGRSCLVQIDLPQNAISPGKFRKDDKASSLLSVGGTLYYAGHSPSVTPTKGYIAISTDQGVTWTQIAGSPWTGSSPFRVLMFISMGQNYQLNKDGYVYAMGTSLELERTLTKPQNVYLARVPQGSIASYSRYEYLSSLSDDGTPTWSPAQADAIALSGLTTLATASAMYHAGTDLYLFLAGVAEGGAHPHGTLYQAPKPWGPWTKAGDIPGISISMLIAKGTGSTYLYFTAAGGAQTYNLNIGRIDLFLSR